ncbi:MAG TPA: hypothetical protein VFQ44_13085 [Streptosporangiaceae bacterium]|nr:hypothetical protein [Streptosporangiaceae bacterium]
MRRHRGIRRLLSLRLLSAPVIAAATLTAGALAPGAAHGSVPGATPHSAVVKPRATGMLDCNGLSPIQHPAKEGVMCADPRGGHGLRFSENGHYIGHDEPSVRFISSAKGSGRNFKMDETLPLDPVAAPAVKNPGSDITDWFELSLAPWISTVVCDPNSAPLLPCAPGSDRNAPKGTYPGAGSAFVELQFYPPGFAPFTDNISCDNTHWCSALTIDSIECTGNGSGPCNDNCVEPINFAFIQLNGKPTGPPSPQLASNATFTPNKNTLLMNPGDKITIRMFDATIKGGHALEAVETDHSTGKSGFMIASGANGFMNSDPFTCDGTRFNFQPEYNTAKGSNILPWGIGAYMINDEYEIGHFEACTSVSKRGIDKITKTISDPFFKDCSGPYETTTENPKLEPDDAPCFKKGDAHGALHAAPNKVTGCAVFNDAIGDLDFDGSSYYPDWPSSLLVQPGNSFPTPFLQGQPTTAGHKYPSIQFVTDLSDSEFNTSCNLTNGKGCVMPPKGPGNFYPYFTLAKVNGSCVWEFGNMTNGNMFGKDGQYGKVGPATIGAFQSAVQANPVCK